MELVQNYAPFLVYQPPRVPEAIIFEQGGGPLHYYVEVRENMNQRPLSSE